MREEENSDISLSDSYFLRSSKENDTKNQNDSNCIRMDKEKSVNVVKNTLNTSTIIVPHRSVKSKRHFCLFCKTLQCSIARHLFSKHKTEKEVKRALHLPLKSKERLSIIDELRKKGDFLHNTTNDHNSGILIVSRRQQQKIIKNQVDDYVCCKNCKGFYSKKTLRIHLRKCGRNKVNDRENITESKRLTQYIHSVANDIVKTRIFPVLTTDLITKSIQYDELIIQYANKLSEKYISGKQHDMIRAQLRLLGRFKIEVKKQNSDIKQLKDIYKPKLFDCCIEAFKIVTKWDNDLKYYKTPAVAQNLNSLIKKCGFKQRSELIKIEAIDLKKDLEDLEDFLLLWQEEKQSLIIKKMKQKSEQNLISSSSDKENKMAENKGENANTDIESNRENRKRSHSDVSVSEKSKYKENLTTHIITESDDFDENLQTHDFPSIKMSKDITESDDFNELLYKGEYLSNDENSDNDDDRFESAYLRNVCHSSSNNKELDTVCKSCDQVQKQMKIMKENFEFQQRILFKKIQDLEKKMEAIENNK